MSTLDDAITTWDLQTALVEAAQHLNFADLPRIKALLKEQRALLELMPFNNDERARVMAALERFEIAVFAKAGN